MSQQKQNPHSNHSNIALGQTIRFFRENSDLRQRDIAFQLGYDQTHWSRIESGIILISFIDVIKFTELMNISMESFCQTLEIFEKLEIQNKKRMQRKKRKVK